MWCVVQSLPFQPLTTVECREVHCTGCPSLENEYRLAQIELDLTALAVLLIQDSVYECHTVTAVVEGEN